MCGRTRKKEEVVKFVYILSVSGGHVDRTLSLHACHSLTPDLPKLQLSFHLGANPADSNI